MPEADTHGGDILYLYASGVTIGPDGSPRRIEYVGGDYPYFWIGTEGGDYFGSIDAGALYDFIDSVRED